MSDTLFLNIQKIYIQQKKTFKKYKIAHIEKLQFLIFVN